MDPFADDVDKVRALRELLPATSAGIYLDTATAGPMPAETARALAEADDWEVRVGRAGMDQREDHDLRAAEARAVFAALVSGADPDQVVLAPGITSAVAATIRALPVGRRALLVEGVPPAVHGALGRDSTRSVARVEAYREALAPDVGLVVIPHVDPTSGERLGLEAMVQAARDAGAAVLLDASATAGVSQLDPAILGVDGIVAPGYQWLLGPEGTCAMWLGPRLLAMGAAGAIEAGLDRLPRRAVLGLARSIGWLEMSVGLPWVFERTAALTGFLSDALASLEGVELITPRQRMAAIVSFRIEGWEPADAARELSRRASAIVGTVEDGHGPAVRTSVGCWNTEAELRRFAEAVGDLARHGPDTLPRRPTLLVLDR